MRYSNSILPDTGVDQMASCQISKSSPMAAPNETLKTWQGNLRSEKCQHQSMGKRMHQPQPGAQFADGSSPIESLHGDSGPNRESVHQDTSSACLARTRNTILPRLFRGFDWRNRPSALMAPCAAAAGMGCEQQNSSARRNLRC